MATDITIGDQGQPAATQRDVDDFIRRHLPDITRAVIVVAGDRTATDQAVRAATRSTRQRWANYPDEESARLAIFNDAAGQLEPPPPPGDTATVAHFGLLLSAEQIALAMHIGVDEVERLIATYHAEHEESSDATDPYTDMRHQLDAVDVDAEALIKKAAPATRSAWAFRSAFAAALILALSLGGAFVASRSDSAAGPLSAAEPTTQPTAEPARPASSGAAAPARTAGAPPAWQTDGVPVLVASNADGFIGLRQTSSSIQPLWSSDGTSWETNGAAINGDLQPRYLTRSPTGSLATFDDDRPTAAGAVGVVSGQADWKLWSIEGLEPSPRALHYAHNITSASTNGSTVLAIVETDITIDFAALQLSEGYTCGHVIEPTRVTVNLCNIELDVLPTAGIDRLPEQRRLFRSVDGGPFTRIPFVHSQSEATIAHVNSAYVLSDEAGMPFAISSDGQAWRSLDNDVPESVTIHAAAMNDAGEIAGLATYADLPPVVFHINEFGFISTPLAGRIDADPPTDPPTAVAHGSGGWAVFVHDEPLSWLLTSPDANLWQTQPVVAPVESLPSVSVGESAVVLLWTTNDGPVSAVVDVQSDN